MTIKYKLLNSDFTTHEGTRWKGDNGEFITVRAVGKGNRLCTAGVVHFYDHPVLAVLFNPLHADIKNPILAAIEIDKEVAHDGLKGGCKQAKIVEILKLPKITRAQKVEFAIRCAKKVYKNAKWNKWADAWLSGKDRTRESARVANAVAYGDYTAHAVAASFSAGYAGAAASSAANAAVAATYSSAASNAAVAGFAADAIAYAGAYAGDYAGVKALFITVLNVMGLL